MPSLEQEPAEPGTGNAVIHASRPALALFALYLLVYGVFVILNAFRPDLMDATRIAGVNLAVAYGLALILLAFLLSLAYALISRRRRDAGDSNA